jgi:hypothetical protein
MIDLFESLIKSHTVVIIAEYVKHNKLSDAAKGMLAQGLRTPSLGTWQLFSRILSEELNADGYGWTFPGFAEAFSALDKALNTAKTNVIAFRNGYAHGATPSDAQCESDIHQFEPFMLQLLQSPWLADTSLEYRDEKVWMASASGALCLHPIFLYKEEGGSSPYAFFNDLKNDKVGLLNYPLSKHYREKDFYQEFHEYLPLQEWKKTGNNEFQQRIEELTETFKGRIGEREKLLDFVRNNSRGYMSIQGNPGIGKSALIAQFFKDLNAHQETHHLQVVEYFIRRGTAQAQVEYLFNHLIRRTDELFAQGREIRAEGKAVWDLQQQLFSKWRLWNTHCEGRKLLFLIDGLDEGVENNVVTYMPRENFENILIIYGSRPGGHKSIDELWSQLPVEHHTKLELSGLGKADIRALIYEVANKYEVERESAWIDAVQQRSQGNPLYLKLLCDAMENGSIALNDIHALPKEIDDYYKAILDRYSHDADGDALLAGLFAFAAARDYLTMNHLGLINGIGDATVQRIGSTLKEVLYENPLTEEVLDYQLFHESFREYLMKEKGSRVTDAAERIIDFCAGWKALEGTREQRYALEHYAFHLSESKKEVRAETLLQLIYDHSYTEAQKKVLQGFDASNAMYRLALKKSRVLKRDDEMLESALCLVDLKYEEANDAPQIVAMVANGEIDLALRRIESFGGVDKEGVQRKFILYMLCLMELTILDSKDKPFRKSSIEKLLNHLDEELPTDHSILNWNDFFPSYLMFQMACEWAEIGLDYSRVYNRTDNWRAKWISYKGPYLPSNFDLLLNCSHKIVDIKERISVLTTIATELNKQGFLDYSLSVMEDAIKCTVDIESEDDRCWLLRVISLELIKQSRVEDAIKLTGKITNQYAKVSTLSKIATKLSKLGDYSLSESIMTEALSFQHRITDEDTMRRCSEVISIELANQGMIDEAILNACKIKNEDLKSRVLGDISTILMKQGKRDESAIVMQEAITCAKTLSDILLKSVVLIGISKNLAKQEKIDEAIEILKSSDKLYIGILGQEELYIEMFKQGKKNQVLEYAISVGGEKEKHSAIKIISVELTKTGKLDEALEWARSITDESIKKSTLKDISFEIGLQNKLNEYKNITFEILSDVSGFCSNKVLKELSTELIRHSQFVESLVCAYEISDQVEKISTLRNISSELYIQKRFDESSVVIDDALALAREIENLSKYGSLKEISIELAKQGKQDKSVLIIQEVLEYFINENQVFKSIIVPIIIEEIINEGIISIPLGYVCGLNLESKITYLSKISTEMYKKGKTDEATSLIKEIHEFVKEITNDSERSISLMNVSRELNKQGQIDESASFIQKAIEFAKKANNENDQKITALLYISTELFKNGKIDEAALLIQDAITIANIITDENITTTAFKEIFTELANQGRAEEALMYASYLKDKSDKSAAFKHIAIKLAEHGKLNESIECAYSINDEKQQNSALKSISIELAKIENWSLAEEISLDITLFSEQQELWKDIVKMTKETKGCKLSLVNLKNLKREVSKLFYLKAWADEITLNDIRSNISSEALLLLANDTESLEYFLQISAQHDLFFGNPSKNKINRLNKTLNIQWALDIIDKFPKEESIVRNSSNLPDWIDQIPDEDDRDQISLWAKQVTKGKITEADFGEKIKVFI